MGAGMRWVLWAPILAAIGIGLVLATAFVHSRPREDRQPQASQQRRQYKLPAMSIDVPPVERPVLVSAADARIDDEAIVIGIVVDGEPRAYLRDAFALGPFNHIVRDTIQSTSVAVTHCDRILCTRVFTSQDPSKPWSIRVGGWRDDQTMDLIVNGSRFSQKSALIPLADVPFSEATWGQWRQKHPNTLIYLGAYRDT